MLHEATVPSSAKMWHMQSQIRKDRTIPGMIDGAISWGLIAGFFQMRSGVFRVVWPLGSFRDFESEGLGRP